MTKPFISSVWDFRQTSLSETNYLTHDYFRWFGKLIPQLVSRLIENYSDEGDTVLANFSGSGTVLVEANIMGRNSIGTDTSPIALLLSKVKTTLITLDIENILDRIEKFIQENMNRQFFMDETDKKWFLPENFYSLQLIKNFIDNNLDGNEKDFFLLALASITKKVSKVDARCVNHIVVDNRKKLMNVYSEFSAKVREMEKSMYAFSKMHKNNFINIMEQDARNLASLENESIDLIISHPPYLGAINYSNIFKLENKLLGFEYTQTKKNDISTNSLDKYMSDMKKVFDEMLRVLRQNSYACVIIGDNRVNGEVIPTFSHFIDYASQIGFKLKDIFIWITSHKAGMNVARRGNFIDHNYILIFQKPIH